VGCAAGESRRLNNDRDLTRKGSWNHCWAGRFTTPYNAPSVGFVKRSSSSPQQPSSHHSRPFICNHYSEWTAERTVRRWLRGPVGCAANESRRLNNDRDLTRKGSWQRCWAGRFTTPYNAPCRRVREAVPIISSTTIIASITTIHP
jgi:hypothetical protein